MLQLSFRWTHTHTQTHTLTRTEALLCWSQLSCCWCWRRLPAAVSDVCSNKLCFTICHCFNTRRSGAMNCGEGGELQRCSPFIRSVGWWIAAQYRWRWRWFISVILLVLWEIHFTWENCACQWKKGRTCNSSTRVEHLATFRVKLVVAHSCQSIPPQWWTWWSAASTKTKAKISFVQSLFAV